MDMQQQIDNLRELLLGVDSKLDKIINENSEKNMKIDQLEVRMEGSIAQLDARLHDNVQQLAVDVERRIDAQISELTTRLDEKLESHMKEVNEIHFRDCENFETLDQRINEVFEGDFTPIIDRRVKLYIEELVHNVQLLFDKVELLNKGMDQRALGSRVDGLRSTMWKMECNMAKVHEQYLQVSDTLTKLVDASAGLEESVIALHENVAIIDQNMQAQAEEAPSRGVGPGQSNGGPAVAVSHHSNGSVGWFNDVEMGTNTRMDFSLMQEEAKEKRKKSKKHKKTSWSERKTNLSDDPGSSDSSSSSSSSDSDESDRPRKSRRRDSDSESEDSDKGRSRNRRSSRGRSKLLDRKYFGSGRRRASIIGVTITPP